MSAIQYRVAVIVGPPVGPNYGLAAALLRSGFEVRPPPLLIARPHLKFDNIANFNFFKRLLSCLPLGY